MIHVSSPGLLVFSGILYAKLLDLPLVVSYHTHIPGKLIFPLLRALCPLFNYPTTCECLYQSVS